MSARAFTDAEIEIMVSRFLQWRLPENFAPDGGISFQRSWRGVDGKEHPYVPTGTNLLDATQAKAMIRRMLDGLP